ncbi:MAG: hypothetical protein RPU13_13490 [Candidatus Sedimenticola sp. (ex Thyasira tokunagai)]
MKSRTMSSESARRVVQAQRNEERARKWRMRWILEIGREPVRILNPALTTEHRALIRRRQEQAIGTGNATVVKMPRRSRQYMHHDLPTSPDAA